MGKPIQLLGQASKGFKINTEKVFRVLDKIANKNVAVISINGNKRTGKSFMLNFFLRYLYAQKKKGKNWISDSDANSISGFEWRGGSEKHTVGIWMGSEPFIIKSKSGEDVAILLLDTQGNFDEKTTFQECGVIFFFIALMSSTLILNMKNEISEDKLQFVEFFTYFAESFSGGTISDDRLFQRLIFLIRDWENPGSHPFGCHDDENPKINNYKHVMIDPHDDQCNEAQNTRKQILSYFENVISFLMPHPGKKVSRDDYIGQRNLIDDEFLEIVETFVPLVFSSSNIEPKKIGGKSVTGASLKEYITKWAEIIKSQKMPEARTLTQATADVNFMLAKNHALAMYETKMQTHLGNHATETQFEQAHQQAEDESIQYFQTEPRGNIDEARKSTLLNDLQKRMDQVYVTLSTINNSHIEREESQRKLNMAIENQIKLENQMVERQNTAIREQEELKNELQNLKDASELERKAVEEKMKLVEDNLKLKTEMFAQKIEHIQEMADIEKKHLEERLEAEERAKQEAQSLISDIKRAPPPNDSSCCIL